MDFTDLRRAVNRGRTREIADRAWERAIGDGFVDDALILENDEAGLGVERLRKLFDDYDSTPRRRVPPPEELPALETDAFAPIRARADALTAWVARLDGETPDVPRYRAEELPDGLLADEAIDAWIVAHFRAAASTDRVVELDWIAQTTNGEFTLESALHPAPPVLARLSDIVDQLLSRGYGWERWEAVRFVLTGEPPLVQPIVARVRTRHNVVMSEEAVGLGPRRPVGETRHVICDAFSRITLDIDPALDPDQVRLVYRQVRDSLRGADGSGEGPSRQRRFRLPTTRMCRLAEFLASRAERGTSLEELRREWNAMHPSWSEDARHFGDRARRAVHSLFTTGWSPMPVRR